MSSESDSPLANGVHIGFFGRRNAGKSSVVNAVTGQALSMVSERQGHHHRPGAQGHGAAAPGPGGYH